tara:strand:- start:1021 stop:2010 length:990 start_codon:yes stop_codon:yes gene_type:complete
MKKINCAVIGLGVGLRHALAVQKANYANLKIVCEFNKKKLKKYSKLFSKSKFVENDDLIYKDPDIDLVIIASYDNYHFSQIKKCIKSKKHFFVEKPFCLKLREFKIIENLLKKTKIKFSSNLILRNHPYFKFLKKQIDSKKIGNLYHLEASYNYGRLPKLTKGWRGKIPFYSVTLGGGIHLVDLVLWLNNYSKIIKVFSIGNSISTKNTSFKFNDLVVAIIKLKNNVTFKLTSNFSCVMPHHHVLEAYGTKKTFIYNFNNAQKFISRSKNTSSIKLNRTYKTSEKSKILTSFIKSLIKNNKKNIVKQNEILNLMNACFKIESALKERKY